MNTAVWRGCCTVALVCCVALAGCKEKSATKANDPTGEVVRYTVRGQVAQMPSDDDPKSEFRVRHEAIPEFRRADGGMGMNTMTMRFPLGEGVTLDGIEIGDIVSLTFAVQYDKGFTKLRGYHTVEINELPADTELDFSQLPESE